MLAIRLQRHGRKDLPVYRLVVQESQRHPSSGRVVTYAGSYDPRSKAAVIKKDKISFYLQNGARPSDRVVRLLQHEKVELPSWVQLPNQKKQATKRPDKLRKHQPKTEAQPAEETTTEAEATE